MARPPEFSSLSSVQKDALITKLLSRSAVLEPDMTALRAENAELREEAEAAAEDAR